MTTEAVIDAIFEGVGDLLDEHEPDIGVARAILLRWVAELTYDCDDGVEVFKQLAEWIEQVERENEGRVLQ